MLPVSPPPYEEPIIMKQKTLPRRELKRQETALKVVPPPLPKIGSLKIKVMHGVIYRNTEIFGDMDPFVLILHKKRKYKTKASLNAGQQPTWNELIEITSVTPDDELKITCFDKDVLFDDCIGLKVLKVSDLIKEFQKLGRELY
jgi:Ca2+-dependent lipid-binding protein